MTCFRMPNGQTLHSWCKQNNKNYDKIWKQLDAGMSIEEVIYGKPQLVKGITLYYRGQPLARLCGGSRTKRYKRIMANYQKGFGLEYAVWKEIQDYGDFTGGL